MKTSTQTFNISFPRALVEQIDAKAEEQFGSRSDFLRTAALQYLRNEQEWEYLFREGKEIGQKAQSRPAQTVADDITAQRRERRRWLAQDK